MIVYTGAPDDPEEVVRFLRDRLDTLRALRKVRITREKTIVFDVNKEGLEFPGLTYGSPALGRLLEELGVIASAERLDRPPRTSKGRTEFDLSARYTWGHDRVM